MIEKNITKDSYIFTRRAFANVHPKSHFHIEILSGIIAYFGEPKSKLYSRRYKLTRLVFSKELYSEDMVDVFWRKFHIKYINHKHKNKKLPPIFRVIGRPDRLIHMGYIIVCEPSQPERENLLSQNSYQYWYEQFNFKGELSGNLIAQETAITLLLNKINQNQKILKDMPTSDWRIFEKLVAEIYRKFGYEIILTKRTKDGGKDIIALSKDKSDKTEKILIECKHWKNKVEVKQVRELVGVAITEDELPTGIILATTSSFTKGAKDLRIHSSISIELEIKDYKAILEWVKEYNAIQMTSREVQNYMLGVH